MTKIRHWRAVVASAAAFLLLLIASAAGLWTTGNRMYSDWLFNQGVVSPAQEPSLLLVEQDRRSIDIFALRNLVAELNELGAKRIVLLSEPGQYAPAELTDSVFDNLVVTSRPEREAVVSGVREWLVVPDFEAGYFRSVPRELSGKNIAGVETEVTLTPWFVRLGDARESGSSRLFLNFSFLKNGLPIVRQQQVSAGDVIREVVEGRTVIVGPAPDPLSPGYPVPGAVSPLTPLKMQGLIWATVESHTSLEPTGPFWTVLLICLLFLLNLFAFQWLSPMFGSVFSCVVIAFVGVAGWGALQYFHVVLPVVDLSVVQLASLLFVYQARRASEDRAVTQMLGTTNAALFERYIPEAFNDSVSPWPKLVVFIRQQLNLDRSILLERVPGDHRVREIEAINCSIDDILEQRRDYERVPYSDALQHRKPLQLRRTYFKAVEEGELEYLTPLIFAGEVLGFWALTVQPQEDWSREAFENNIGSFALQISELLYHRQQLAVEKQRERRLGRRVLALEVGRNYAEQLRSALELLGNRLATLEAMFDSLKTGAVMYDLFGEVLQANARALEIAARGNLAVYQLTALDFLCQLCGLSQDDARRHLRHVTLKRAEVRLPVTALADTRALTLAIRPISSSKNKLDASSVASAAQPFKLLGLSFEITDASYAGAALERRDDLLQELFLNLRNQLSRVTLAAHLTSPELKDSQPGQRLLGEVLRFGTAVEARIEEVEKQVASSETPGFKAAEPVNLLRAMDKALRRSEPLITQKRLTVLRDLPYVVSLVGAVADELSELLDRVLNLLISDATPGTQLVVSVKERMDPDPLISLTLSNTGYGLPQKALDRLLAKPMVELLNSDDAIEEMIGTVKSISSWGGQTEITATVGKGFCLKMHFKPLTSKPSLDHEMVRNSEERGRADKE